MKINEGEKDCGKRGHARANCVCKRCSKTREREREHGRKYRKKNKEKILARQRDNRKKTNNKDTKKYEKTPRGYLMRSYRNMTNRVKGIGKQGSWTGQEILPKEEFYEWSLNNTEFWRLFRQYELSNYELKLAPSVNRIDSSKGYTIDNIEWVTQGVNSALSSVTRNKTLNDSLMEVASLVN